MLYGERADDEKHLTGIFIKACAVSDLVLVLNFFLIALFSDSFFLFCLLCGIRYNIKMKGSLLRVETFILYTTYKQFVFKKLSRKIMNEF